MVAILLSAALSFNWGFLPAPIIPADNPLTEAKVALGKKLFHETKLSMTGDYACATCHQPERHFTDGLPRAIGATGEVGARNTPTLYYTAYNASLGWTDAGSSTLEQQHRTPLFNTDPLEMGYSESLLPRLQQDTQYVKLFAQAFTPGAINTDNIVKALASYVRTLTPPPTAFDDYLFNDNRQALSTSARAGMTLFFSARLGCSQCHTSLALSGPISHTVTRAKPVFHIMGVGGSTEGFRAPTLRYISHTAPYMHNGSMKTLQEVLTHYLSRPSERVPAFSLTAEEQQQLLDFLHTL